MEFDHEKHHRTNILLISASEEVIETLEDNQVSEVNLMMERYVLCFKGATLSRILAYDIAHTFCIIFLRTVANALCNLHVLVNRGDDIWKED